MQSGDESAQFNRGIGSEVAKQFVETQFAPLHLLLRCRILLLAGILAPAPPAAAAAIARRSAALAVATIARFGLLVRRLLFRRAVLCLGGTRFLARLAPAATTALVAPVVAGR